MTAPSHPPSTPHPVPPAPRLFSLTWPLLVELLLGMTVGVAGTALAARLSDTSGAAFALAHHVFATLFLVFRIVGAGVGVVLTQALGAGRRDAADSVARAVLGASTWIGLAVALPAALGAPGLLRLMNAPAEVLPLAVPLLVALAPAMLLDAWNASMTAVMRAYLRARDTLAVMVAMQIAHLALMGPLMFGIDLRSLELGSGLGLGLVPGLGLVGYAVAVIVARLLAIALHLWLWRTRLGLRPVWADAWRLRRADLVAVARIGLPGAAENIAYRLAYMVSVAVAGSLGALALSTHAYAMQSVTVVLLFGMATGLSVEILVGRLVGAGRLHEAHTLVRRALAWGLAVSVGVATLAALGAPWTMRLFTQDAQIIHAATVLLWWTVVLEPGRTFNLVVINALRATGDARFPVVAGAASMLVVLAGGSWLLGSHFGLGLVGVWIAYIADEWLRGLIMWRRWATLAWVPHARASHRRLKPVNAAPG